MTSGLGTVSPQSLLLVPVYFDGYVLAVMELASLHQLGEDDMNFVEQAVESIGISIHTNMSRVKLNEALKETQRQSEALQAQQEELQASNENLEEQTRLLKASEESLTAQGEELKFSNEEWTMPLL